MIFPTSSCRRNSMAGRLDNMTEQDCPTVPKKPTSTVQITRKLVSTVAMSLLFAACAGTQVGADSEPAAGSTLTGNYLAGRHAQMEGDMDAAAIYLGAALEMDAEEVDLIRRTFLVYLSDGQYEEAFKLAEIIIEHIPDDMFAMLSLISRDIGTGEFASARERIARLKQEGISAYLAPLLTAWSHTGDGDSEAAMAAIAPLGQSNATSMLYNAHAALIQAVAGNGEEAEKLFGSLMEAQGSLSLRTTELLGAYYEMDGRFNRAIALYNGYRAENGNIRLINTLIQRAESKQAPKGPYMTAAEGAAEAFLDLTGSLRQQNSIESALLLSRLGLYLRPSFPTFQLMTGSMLEELDQYADANDVYADIDPNSGYAWSAQLRISTNLDTMGETEQAIAALRRMADENPDEPGPLIDLGDVLRSAERFDEAVIAYDEAVERLPEESLRRYWSLFYARGIALERAKDWPRAEADLLLALEYKPDQPYVLNYLGYSWIEKRMNMERAKEMIQKAVNLRPHDGYIVDSLGWVYYQTGDFENAVTELERAVELMPEDPIINDHLGDAYWRVGRHREARFQWRRSLSLDPEPDAVAVIQDKIENGMADHVTAVDSGSNG